MSRGSRTSPVLICCSIYQAEVESLRRVHWPELNMRVVTSMLHMRPDQLTQQLDTVVEQEIGKGNSAVLIYGDCCYGMADLEARPGVARTRGNNCYELLLGHEEYRRISREGGFFLLPEWTRRWREVFAVELGLNQENASSLMREVHRKLVFLDTGLVPVPTKSLLACAEYCGLPSEVQPLSMEYFRSAIQEALCRLDSMRGQL